LPFAVDDDASGLGRLDLDVHADHDRLGRWRGTDSGSFGMCISLVGISSVWMLNHAWRMTSYRSVWDEDEATSSEASYCGYTSLYCFVSSIQIVIVIVLILSAGEETFCTELLAYTLPKKGRKRNQLTFFRVMIVRISFSSLLPLPRPPRPR
jgi:hypothetical protein